MIELKTLKTFNTVVEEGSFAAAARKLNYTQSAITFQMRQLEGQLSLKLFERIGKNMVLTEEGKEVIPLVTKVLGDIENLENHHRGAEELRGELRLAMPESLLTYFMPSLINEFRRQAPNVHIDITMENCYSICDRILAGKVDIGLHYDISLAGKSVVAHKIEDHKLCLLTGAKQDAQIPDLSVQDGRCDIDYYTDDCSSIYHRAFDGYLRDNNISQTGVVQLGSIEAVKKCIAGGLGFTVMPRFVADKEISEGILAEHKVPMQKQKISSVVVYHKNKELTPAMELFVRLAKQYGCN